MVAELSSGPLEPCPFYPFQQMGAAVRKCGLRTKNLCAGMIPAFALDMA